MKKLAPLLFVAACALLVAGSIYFYLSMRPGDSPAPSLTGVEHPSAQPNAAAVESKGEIEAATKNLTAIGDEATKRATIEVDPARAVPAEKRCTLSVIVALPAGAPADDQPELLVIGKLPEDPEDIDVEESLALLTPGDPLPKWLLARVALDSGAAKEIALERSSLPVSVSLRARFSYAESVDSVDISGERGDATLKASLGACVRGRLIAPSNASPEQREFAGAKVKLRSNPFAGGATFGKSGAVSRDGVCNAEGRFELGGVAPVSDVTLSGTPEHLAAFKSSVDGLAPGKVVEVEVALAHGSSASGKVLDEGGAPVADAKLSVRADSVIFGQGGRVLREGKSREDGSFSLAAIAAGQAVIDVSAKGHLEVTTDIEFVEGGQVTDLVLRLEGGTRVAGKVTWADGSVAVSTEVKASFDPAHLVGMEAFNAMRGGGGGGVTDERGEFSIGGLGKGPFVVKASAVPAGSIEGEDAQPWTAQINNVKPGTLDLKLSLGPPSDIAGRVVDDAGAPITECTVVIAENSHNPYVPGAESHNIKVANETGSFSAPNLPPGEYTAKARMKSGANSPAVAFELPRADDAGELLITLPRPATISGRVLLPDGSPAANARVHQQFSVFDMARGSAPGSEPSCTTGEDGSFSTTSMPIGSISLRATKDGFAPSEGVGVKTEPATSVSDITLALRIGGTITGEAFGKDGLPQANATILAQMPDLRHGQLWAKSDANGKFEYTHVAPGQWQVMLLGFESKQETKPDSDAEDQSAKDMANFMDQLKLAMANVKEGGSVHVLLGAPAKDPVHVRGRVTVDKIGVAGLMVSFLPTDGGGKEGAALSSMKMKPSDQDGRFEIDLDHSGSYLVSVQKIDMSSGAQQSLEFSRTIPDGPECSLEFELPLGSITGRVSAGSGDPLPRTRITLNVDGPLQGGTMTGGRYSEAQTDERGEFAFDWLAPGSYTVSAGGLSMADLFAESIPMGRQVRDRIRVSEGERVGGIDFKLKSACELSGKVLDVDGKPLGEASIFVRDEEGRSLDRISFTTTDASGNFHQRGLTPGRFSVSARSAGLVSGEINVVLREGEPSAVELHMDEGTMLTVVVTDKDDLPVLVSLSVTDEKGRQMNGLYSLSDLMRTITEGNFDAKQPRIGPLAPGKYQITAIAADGTKLTRSVNLLGQSQRKITLKLEK